MKDSTLIAFLKTMPEPFSMAEVNFNWQVEQGRLVHPENNPVLFPQWLRLRKEGVIEFAVKRRRVRYWKLTSNWK